MSVTIERGVVFGAATSGSGQCVALCALFSPGSTAPRATDVLTGRWMANGNG